MNKENFLKLIEDKENIIFDFGGILIDIDYSKTVQALSRLSSTKNAESLYSQSSQVELFTLFETGQIPEDHFLRGLCNLLNIDVAKREQVKDAWNEMLLGIKKERIEFLEELKLNKRIFMLSNINETHEKYIAQYLKRSGINSFYKNFEKVYFSHKIGFRKPNPEIFKYVLKDSSLNIDETIFIDDSKQHIEGAQGIGLQTIFLEKQNSFL